MAKRMLVDATHPEETRVVVVSGNRLEDMDFEIASRRQLKGNIYLAKVTRVEPSLQAAFVEYGGNRHGFLAFAEIHPDYYRIPIADREALLAEERRLDEQADRASDISHVSGGNDAEAVARTIEEAVAIDTVSEPVTAEIRGNGDEVAAEVVAESPDVIGGDEEDEEEAQRRRQRPLRSYKIQEVVKRRQVMLVQVTKEERGNKGAALTTYLSLPGRYCVLMPNTGRGGGISRKITNPADRKRLKEILSDLDVPEGMAVILRTAGLERSKQEIKRDLEYLLRLWDDIREQTLKSSAPCLIYEEANLIKRSIRDLYADDIDEIWIEGEAGFQTAKDFMRMLMPGHSKRVLQYRDETIPLFHRYQVETQIDAIHSPVVQLKSGGYIVINPTEALVSIDVNSGKSTRERNIEETAYKTNLEAADEVARQLRLRDLAGLIVIDFIDMEESRNNVAVERRMKEAMKNDRARIQLGRISAFGLLELSRQRLRPSLLETNFERCPHCSGTGVVRSVESAALHVLRAIEEEGIRKRSAEITTYVNSSIALYILNQKRTELTRIEERYRFKVMVQADDTLIAPDLRIERIKARLPEDDAPLVSVDRAVAETDRALAAEAEEIEDSIVDDVEEVEEIETGERQAEAADSDSEGENDRRRRRRRRRRGRNERENGDRITQTDEEATEADALDEPADSDLEADVATAVVIPNTIPADDLAQGEDDEDEDGEGEGDGIDANGDLGNGDRRKRRRGKRGGRRRNRQRETETGSEADDHSDDAAATAIVPLDDATLDAILTGEPVEVPAAAQATVAETISSEPVVEAPAKPTRRRKTAGTAPAEPAAKPTRGRKAKATEVAAAEEVAEVKPTRRRTTKKVEAEAAPVEVVAEVVAEVAAKPTRRRTTKKVEAEAAPAETVAEVPAKPTRSRKAKVVEAVPEATVEVVAEVPAKPTRRRTTKKVEAEAAPAETVAEVVAEVPAKPVRGRKTKVADSAPASEAKPVAKRTATRKAKATEAVAVEAAAPEAQPVAPVVEVAAPAPAEPAAPEKAKRGWWAR